MNFRMNLSISAKTIGVLIEIMWYLLYIVLGGACMHAKSLQSCLALAFSSMDIFVILIVPMHEYQYLSLYLSPNVL